jgi:ubiquinone/menaquinone biosynthesis C-methylase UbiE
MDTKINQGRVLKVYGDSAHTVYVAFMDDYVRRIEQDSRDAYKALFEQLVLEPGQRVLEVGIGTGRNMHRYSHDVSLVGVDLTPQMLEMAEKRAQKLGRDIELSTQDATSLQFDDSSFDSVVSTYTLCVTQEPQRVMDEMVRVCKPSGRIGLYDCRMATSDPHILKSQQFLADTILTAGLFFEGRSAVVYNILSDLDVLVETSGLKVVDKRIMEHGPIECLGMYVLEK